MTIKDFTALARKCEADVGDVKSIFSSEGCGTSFCFSLAAALTAYLTPRVNGQDSPEYAMLSSLAVAPISFNPGMGFSESAVEDGTDDEWMDASTIISLIKSGAVTAEACYEALLWHCTKTVHGDIEALPNDIGWVHLYTIEDIDMCPELAEDEDEVYYGDTPDEVFASDKRLFRGIHDIDGARTLTVDSLIVGKIPVKFIGVEDDECMSGEGRA